MSALSNFPSPTRKIRIAAMLAAVLGLFLSPTSAKELDRVVLQIEGRSTRVAYRGEIMDYTGRTLKMRLHPNAIVREFSRDQVIEVETPQTQPHVEGLLHFTNGEIAQAQDALARALKEEPRAWVRREILAMLTRCALQEGDYVEAATNFLAMARSDEHTPHYRLAPLVWTNGTVTASLRAQARVWIDQSFDPARLLAASVLLEDPEFGERAEQTLRELNTNRNANIRYLAMVQLWRVRLRHKSEMTASEPAVWQIRLEAMPEHLRGGAYYLLGRAHLSRDEYEQAAVSFLRLPLVYRDDANLAARSLMQAADALQQIGRKTEAIGLYREVVFRYSKTASAYQASEILKSLTPNDSESSSTSQSASESE